MYCAICGLWPSHHDPGIVGCAGGVLCCVCMCAVGYASGVSDKSTAAAAAATARPRHLPATEHQLCH